MSKAFTAEEFEIKFYAQMSEWVSGGKVGPDPRGEWEFALVNGPAWVHGGNTTPYFKSYAMYRWKYKEQSNEPNQD